MIKYRIPPPLLSGSVLLLALILALSVAGLAAAQAQLPGIRLTRGPANNLRPSWSPDGSQIAYFSNESGSNDIWAMNADGSNQRQLTNDPADDRRPAWSPDGKYLAFDSDRAGSRDVWIMDAEGGNLRQLTSGPGEESFPGWSPDGTQIAYFTFSDGVLGLWALDVDGKNPRQVVDTVADQEQKQCTFACHKPAWSPDSSQIAYPQMNHTEIWVVGADGGNAQPLAHEDDGHEHKHFPQWLPDGRLLYLTEYTNDRQEPVNDVWVADADGDNAALLFAGIPHGGPLEFKPDDDATIAFHSPRAGNFDIYTTVLGEEAPAPAERARPTEAVPAEVTAVSAPEPTGQAEAAPAPEPTAVAGPTATRSAGLPGRPLAAAVLAALALGSGLLIIYLARRGRAS